MNAEDLEAVDLYIRQLKDVFDSCDVYRKGYLSRNELIALCHKLQLEKQAAAIADHLIDKKNKIDFDQFKDNFVRIICQSAVDRQGKTTSKSFQTGDNCAIDQTDDKFIDGKQFFDGLANDADDEEEEEESNDRETRSGDERKTRSYDEREQGLKRSNHFRDRRSEEHEVEDIRKGSPTVSQTDITCDIEQEVSPKYIQGNKRYGRRSRPFQPGDFEELPSTDCRKVNSKPPLPPQKKHVNYMETSEGNDDEGDSHKKARTELAESDSDGEVEKEMFEAEGQLNLNLSELEQAQEISGHEEYLRNIWKTLNVGLNGYITVQELARVCNSIGMEMSKDELQQLFEKLDSDNDGCLSFDDFITGVFHHNNGSTSNRPTSRVATPRSMTPRALSAQKKLRAANEERTTPSLISGSGVSGLFSVLNVDQTGFAMPDHVIDLWEKYNITNGADIILALGFDLVTKINLSELSFALEQEMLVADEENAIYQAAFASYQQEIIHLKSSLEQQLWATDKLKSDLSEANSRNAMLAKEVDERHLQIEQSTEKKLISIEKKYQDQVKSLQSDLELERVQAASLKNRLDSERENLEEEDKILRQKFAQAQKDVEKMEKELLETSGKLNESEKLNSRLQRDLENVVDLQHKWEEYENSDMLTPEQQKFNQEQLTKTSNENKILKDMNDELTAEVESLKQQILTRNKSEHSSKTLYDFGSRIPIREGSFLSDYVKTKRGVRSSVSSENSEDEGLSIPNHPGRVRRRLPLAPADDDDTCSVSSIQSDRDYIEILKKEITDMKIHHEREKKELEINHRNDLYKLEEKYEIEREDLQQRFRQEQNELLKDCDESKVRALKENERNMHLKFESEKADLIRKHEDEVQCLKDSFQAEKQKIIDNLQEEFRGDLQAQVSQIKSESKHESDLELKLAYSREELQQLKQENDDLKEQLVFQKEELSSQFEHEQKELRDELESTLAGTESAIRDLEKDKVQLTIQMDDMCSQLEQEKLLLQENFEKELQKIENEYRKDLNGFENIFSQGESALKGQLRVDFYDLLSKHKDEITTIQKEEMKKNLQKERLLLEKAFVQQKVHRDKEFEKEKEDLVKKYEEQVEFLRQQVHNLEDKMENERQALSKKLEDERKGLEEELASAVREELEDEFVNQMEELRRAYEEEKKQLMQQVVMLQEELDDIYKEINSETSTRKKIDDLNRTINALQKDKKLAEKAQAELQKALQMTKSAMESCITKINEEKEGALMAVKTEFLEAAKESGKQKVGIEKAILEATCREKEILEKRVEKLQTEISELQKDLSANSDLQEKMKLLEEENKVQKEKLKQLEFDLATCKTSAITEHAQHVIDELKERNTFLEDTLSSAQHKLTRVDDKVDKLTKLQIEYNKECKETRVINEKIDSLNKPVDSTAEDLYKEKEKLQALSLEKARLEEELEKVSQKLEAANENLVKYQSQNSRRGRGGSPVDIENFTKLQIDLVDQQRQLREMHELMNNKDLEKSKKFKVKEEQQKKIIQGLEEEKTNLTRKLKLTQEMLDEQLQKINTHYEECEKRNILVVDLYKENSDLMEALFLMEERKKDAVSRCYKLEDQCKVLRLMLKKVCHVAIS